MSKRGKLATIGVGLALAFGPAACGGDDSSAPSASQSTQTVTATEAEQRQGAKRFIREHYKDVNRGSFDAAFADLSPELQDELGPLSAFKDGYRFTEGTQVKSLDTLEASEDRAVVAIQLYADAIDACDDHIAQTFAGTLDVDLSGPTPVLADADITWTDGEPAIEDVSDCPKPPRRIGTGPGPGPVGSFCDTHDCIPNFDNGRGSRVQCADGTWSQSGGIQGACSWHGGVR